MRALEFITGHVIYNPAYTYKFQLKTTYIGLEKIVDFDLLCYILADWQLIYLLAKII